MKYEIDCQIHSFFSPDADQSPRDIFKRAKILGLEGVVITDHNTTAHFSNVKSVAKDFNLYTCLALEITASYEGSDIHILAYGDNLNTYVLEPMLQRIRKSYNKRSKEMIRKLSSSGVAKISFKSLLKQTQGDCVTKPLLARNLALLKNINQKEALSFFERGGIAYVPYGAWIPKPAEVVRLVLKAGGKAVFAHPGEFFGKRSSLPIKKRVASFNKLLSLLLEAGLSGIEVYYPSHTPGQISYFKNIAKKYKLLISGGSDYHGPIFSHNREMGNSGVSLSEFLKLVS